MRLFENIKVIEFTSNLAGPYAGALMADFGAEIIKIEQPGYGDNCRAFNPQIDGASTMFMFLNRGKKSLAIDLNNKENVEFIKILLAETDVVIECNKPGMMEKYGLGYEDIKKIKPDIIMCRISAFGQTGPDRHKPGHDLMAQAASGAMDVTGEPGGAPTLHGFALSAYLAATYAFGAISTALFHRGRTSEGQCIDISLLDSLFSINDYVEPASVGESTGRTGNHHTLLAPFGVYEGNGGSVAIAALTPKAWESLCRLTNRMDMFADAGLATSGKRMDRVDEVTAMINGWLQSFDDVSQALQLLEEAGIPCSKINSAVEAIQNAQLLARGMVAQLETPAGTKITSRGNPMKFSADVAQPGAAPAIGQHNDEILNSKPKHTIT